MLRLEGLDSLLIHSTKVAIGLLSRSSLSPRSSSNTGNRTLIRHLSSGPFFLHALASPVSSLSISLDLCTEILKRIDRKGETKALLVQARQDVRYLQRVILANRELTHARFGRYKLKTALQEVVTRLNQPWNGQLLLVTLAVPETTTVKGQPYFLQEAISCLIKNAFEAYGPKRKRTVLLTCFTHQTQVVIQVSDLGMGMDWLTNHLAVHSGLSTKGDEHGYGLKFVRFVAQNLLRGRVHVQSSKHLGTTVTVIIPSSNEQSLE